MRGAYFFDMHSPVFLLRRMPDLHFLYSFGPNLGVRQWYGDTFVRYWGYLHDGRHVPAFLMYRYPLEAQARDFFGMVRRCVVGYFLQIEKKFGHPTLENSTSSCPRPPPSLPWDTSYACYVPPSEFRCSR